MYPQMLAKYINNQMAKNWTEKYLEQVLTQEMQARLAKYLTHTLLPTFNVHLHSHLVLQLPTNG